MRLHGLLDDGEEALAQLISINFLAQRRGEGFDSFDRLPITKVETPLNKRLEIYSHRIKDDRPGERGGDKDDTRNGGARVDEQFHFGDGTIVNERQADCEQEIDRRSIENHIEHERGKFEVVALELRNGEVHEHRKKDEFNISMYEDRQQGE